MKNELPGKGLHTHLGVWSRTKIILSFNCAYYVLDNLLNVNQILAISHIVPLQHANIFLFGRQQLL